MLKLLVVEDHALVREGLVRLLAQVDQEVEVAEAADFETALSQLEDAGEYDLVFLDLALPGIDGFSGLDVLRRRYPAMPVVVKTPAAPLTVSPPAIGAAGEWRFAEGDDGSLEATFVDAQENLLGFALLGGAPATRQALTKRLPAVLG